MITVKHKLVKKEEPPPVLSPNVGLTTDRVKVISRPNHQNDPETDGTVTKELCQNILQANYCQKDGEHKSKRKCNRYVCFQCPLDTDNEVKDL